LYQTGKFGASGMTKDKKIKRTKKCHQSALGLINKPEPENVTNSKQAYERIACVFQGGGALGAYQVGAYRALQERGYTPDYLAGVSIGSINCAIIAGNPPEKQVEKLLTFWDMIVPKLWTDLFINYDLTEMNHHMHNRLGAMHALFNGLDGFFKPRLFTPSSFSHDTPDNLSYYNTSELRTTLESLIDFDLINEKKVTLCLGAVNVASGEMVFFNNQNMKLTADHVMASGALPPGFPAIKIGEDYFWDGGIYANTPLVTLLNTFPQMHTLCFVVDCFRLKGHLPLTMDQMDERQKDIRYASHSRRLTNVYAVLQNLQSAIEFLGGKLTPEAQKDPEVQKILALGVNKRFSVVHIIYNGTPYSHSFKDYNFVRSAINYRMKEGYNNTITVLNKPDWEKQSTKTLDCSIYGVPADYFEQH
jgi:NTE family protein